MEDYESEKEERVRESQIRFKKRHRTNLISNWSLGLAIVGLFIGGIPFGLVSTILGVLALAQGTEKVKT